MIMTLLVCTSLLLCSMVLLVECYPDGAPEESCKTLAPSSEKHDARPQTTTSPYSLNISGFNDGEGYHYELGKTYQCKYISIVHVK